MPWLKVSAPTHGEKVLILGLTVSGEAEGALVEIDIPTLVPRIPQPGEIQKTVIVKKWVAIFPTVKITLQSLVDPAAADITQSAPVQHTAGLSSTFSLHVKPPSVGLCKVTVISDIPDNNSEASQTIQVDVFDPRAEVPPGNQLSTSPVSNGRGVPCEWPMNIRAIR